MLLAYISSILDTNVEGIIRLLNKASVALVQNPMILVVVACCALVYLTTMPLLGYAFYVSKITGEGIIKYAPQIDAASGKDICDSRSPPDSCKKSYCGFEQSLFGKVLQILAQFMAVWTSFLLIAMRQYIIGFITACWYFGKDPYFGTKRPGYPSNPGRAGRGILLALTKSFGGIALGALILLIIDKILNKIKEKAKGSVVNKILLCWILCIIACMELHGPAVTSVSHLCCSALVIIYQVSKNTLTRSTASAWWSWRSRATPGTRVASAR